MSSLKTGKAVMSAHWNSKLGWPTASIALNSPVLVDAFRKDPLNNKTLNFPFIFIIDHLSLTDDFMFLSEN